MRTTPAHPSSLVLGLALAAIGAAGAVASLVAQTPAAEPITVRFLAIGADGKPVSTVKSDQVSVRVDGKPRNVQSLQFVSLDAAAPTTAGPAAKPFETPLPPPYGTNLSEPSRLIQLVIDEESIRPGSDRLLKDALDQFVASLPPKDRVGLITLPHGTVKIDPTNNHASVRETITKIAGRAPGAARSASEEQCHTRDVLDELRNLGTMMSATDDQQTLVFFTLALTAAGRSAGTTGSASCDLTTTDFQRTGSAIAASRPTVYVVLPETITNTDGIQNLTGVLNAQLLNMQSGAADAALTRVVRETAGYYVATFDADPNDRNGASHRMELKVAGNGLTVRAPVELAMPKADPKATGKPNVKDVVKETKPYRDVPLRAAAFVSRAKDVKDKVQVLILVEPTDPSTKFSAASFGIADASGKMSQWTAAAEDLAKPLLFTALLAPPGALRVRAAVADASGRVGAADYNLTGDLTTAGPMKLSSILLGATGPSGFQPRLQFKDETEAVAQFDIYGGSAGMQIRAELDLATSPDATTAISTAQIKFSGSGEADRFIASGTFPISQLAPGDYVVRATVGVEGQPAGKVVRTLRKVK